MLTLDIKQYNLTKITITVVNRPPNENYFVLDTLYYNKKNPQKTNKSRKLTQNITFPVWYLFGYFSNRLSNYLESLFSGIRAFWNSRLACHLLYNKCQVSEVMAQIRTYYVLLVLVFFLYYSFQYTIKTQDLCNSGRATRVLLRLI